MVDRPVGTTLGVCASGKWQIGEGHMLITKIFLKPAPPPHVLSVPRGMVERLLMVC